MNYKGEIMKICDRDRNASFETGKQGGVMVMKQRNVDVQLGLKENWREYSKQKEMQL